METPTKQLVEKRLKIALDLLILRDSYLLENNLHERTIVHKLAMYLQEQFTDWNVDVEYNRSSAHVKVLQLADGKTKFDVKVYPDIIIHKRGSMIDNLVAIEIKKSSSSSSKDAEDKKKLLEYKEQLNYQFALFIKFTRDMNYKIEIL